MDLIEAAGTGRTTAASLALEDASYPGISCVSRAKAEPSMHIQARATDGPAEHRADAYALTVGPAQHQHQN